MNDSFKAALLAILTAVLLCVAWAVITDTSHLEGDHGILYVVRTGDTVDGIARCLAGEGADKRYVVAEIANANGKATFQAGDTMAVPAKVTANATACGIE